MMDNRGNIAVEIAIVLAITLMITGIVLNTSELMSNKAIKSAETENTEILISEMADNLINNPGTPDNWEEYGKGTPGLAIVNEEGEIIPNSVSYEKLMALKKNYKKLVDEKMFGSKIKTSVELIPQESSISSVKIGNSDENKDTYSVNRLVKCDFFKNFVLKDFQHGGKCNHRHSQDSHSCNYFKVFKGNLRSSNYYLLIDSSEKNDLEYIIDTTRVVKGRMWENPESDKIYLNDKINFYDDPSAVVFIHFNKPKVKAVLVSVPKNFNMHNLNYDYFRTNDCNLILKAWY
ncbi:MAG: hypothetical protein U0L42_04035 [Methanobrevibacter sp.]|uniref:hypothetical protein n=1 Tax=Methanobrevibacter sp. TaxID=66852 RepID=UPI002E77CFEF|nr:hypothetical protein [Methanobrevibacter sp.]MEE0934822.1 hypothetical protein [Methanobrevibacter sp.]